MQDHSHMKWMLCVTHRWLYAPSPQCSYLLTGGGQLSLQWRRMSAMASQIPASRVFAQMPFVQAQIKEDIEAPRHRPLWGESTGERWIPPQRASNAENVSIWWRHHLIRIDTRGHNNDLSQLYSKRCWQLFPGHATCNSSARSNASHSQTLLSTKWYLFISTGLCFGHLGELHYLELS